MNPTEYVSWGKVIYSMLIIATNQNHIKTTKYIENTWIYDMEKKKQWKKFIETYITIITN